MHRPRKRLLSALMASAALTAGIKAQTTEQPDLTKQPTLYAVGYAHLDRGGGSATVDGNYNAPIGANFYNGLETTLNKRVTGANGRGFSFQLSYTYSKTINEDGYRNGWPYQDPEQIHQLANSDRTHVFTFTPVYDLPFGRGGMFLSHPNGLVDRLISDWRISGILSAQSGSPLGIPGSWYDTCPSLKPAGGSTLGHWFSDVSCWTAIPTYGLSPVNQTTEQVRNPTIPNLDVTLQKTTRITERLGLDLRFDAFNATNSVLFGGPDNNPGDGAPRFTPGAGWSGFGTVGPTQLNFPRILQVGGKLSF